MLLFASLLLLLLAPDLKARPQDCEIFGDCASEPECDEIFGDCEEVEAPAPLQEDPDCAIFDTCVEQEIEVDTRSDCFDSINEIDSLDNDGRFDRNMKI